MIPDSFTMERSPGWLPFAQGRTKFTLSAHWSSEGWQEQYLLKVGGTLRKLSLDELPNLINILKGEMVFVGPRPALYNQEDLMQLRINAGVSHLKPGLTGWAQINGRDEISLEDKVAFEKEYLEKKSLCCFVISCDLHNCFLIQDIIHLLTQCGNLK